MKKELKKLAYKKRESRSYLLRDYYNYKLKKKEIYKDYKEELIVDDIKKVHTKIDNIKNHSYNFNSENNGKIETFLEESYKTRFFKKRKIN